MAQQRGGSSIEIIRDSHFAESCTTSLTGRKRLRQNRRRWPSTILGECIYCNNRPKLFIHCDSVCWSTQCLTDAGFSEFVAAILTVIEIDLTRTGAYIGSRISKHAARVSQIRIYIVY